jgi:hypothetical protein
VKEVTIQRAVGVLKAEVERDDRNGPTRKTIWSLGDRKLVSREKIASEEQGGGKNNEP